MVILFNAENALNDGKMWSKRVRKSTFVLS